MEDKSGILEEAAGPVSAITEMKSEPDPALYSILEWVRWFVYTTLSMAFVPRAR